MTSDSHLFVVRQQLEIQGYELCGNQFIKTNKIYFPLFEGKSVEIYDHRYASIDINPDNPSRKAYQVETTVSQYRDPYYSAVPQYWIEDEVVFAAAKDFERDWFIVYKRTTTASSERTLKSCAVPFAAIGDKLPFVVPYGVKSGQVLCLLANLNSFAADFVARQKTGYVNLAQFVFEQFPILPPHSYNSELLNLIVPRVLELSYTAWDLQPFAQDVGWDGPPFVWDEERRFLMRCELDALYFHLYGIERDDVGYIMETFPIVKRKDEAAHGHYRTKDTILAMYDEMAALPKVEAPHPKGLDEPYLVPDVSQFETWLSPGPADPSVAHEARD